MRYLTVFLLISFLSVNAVCGSQTASRRLPANPCVCIDPGHPSEVNSGSAVQNGTTEVHIAWCVAQKLQRLLKERGVSVVMTKGRERLLVRNRERAKIANAANADLMIRLHCDTGRGQGFAVYYPDRQGRKDGVSGPPAQVIRSSKLAAQAVHTGMRKALGSSLRDGGLRGDSMTYVGSRQGALTGSIFAQVPVVTVEMVFLSDKSDAAFIKSADGQQRMAQAICDGVMRFITAAKRPG